MNNRAKEFVSVLELLHENVSQRDKVLRFCPGLTKIDCFLLQFLYTTKVKVVMTDLARVLNVSYSRVSRVMDNLCELNLAKRLHSENDRRSWYATLTHEGEVQAEKIRNGLVDHQESVLRMIPEERLDDLLELLTVYTKAFVEITKNNLKEEDKDNDC